MITEECRTIVALSKRIIEVVRYAPEETTIHELLEAFPDHDSSSVKAAMWHLIGQGEVLLTLDMNVQRPKVTTSVTAWVVVNKESGGVIHRGGRRMKLTITLTVQ